MRVAEQVRQFIVKEIGWDGDPEDLTPELPLIDSGVLDSLAVLALVEYLESTFSVVIEDNEMVPANLADLARIQWFVEAKVGSTG